MEDKKNPLISIITPTFNRGKFLEEHILSVKNQDYKNIEHIIVDGLSDDNSVEILKKYEGSYNLKWISEKDSGCADGMNKGFRMATGDIWCWLDSDDKYFDGTLSKVIKVFQEKPEIDFVFGNMYVSDQNGKIVDYIKLVDFSLEDLIYYGMVLNPQTSFWKKELHQKTGEFDISYKRATDYDFFIRMKMQPSNYFHLNDFLAVYRLHSEQLTVTAHQFSENDRIFLTYSEGHLPQSYFGWRKRKIFIKRVLKFTLRGDFYYITKRTLERIFDLFFKKNKYGN